MNNEEKQDLINRGFLEREQIITNKTQYPDSINIGTPGKGGDVKVYFNASNKVEAKQRIENAIEMCQLAEKLKSGDQA